MLIGNVGGDPNVRYLEGNAKVASFTLATTERYKDRNGEQRENTEWHNIVAWRNTADIVENYVKKGTQLYIEGKIRTRNYTDQSGVKKYVTEIVADSIQLLGRRSDDAASAPVHSAPSQTAAPAPAAAPKPVYEAPTPSVDEGQDDLPF